MCAMICKDTHWRIGICSVINAMLWIARCNLNNNVNWPQYTTFPNQDKAQQVLFIGRCCKNRNKQTKKHANSVPTLVQTRIKSEDFFMSHKSSLLYLHILVKTGSITQDNESESRKRSLAILDCSTYPALISLKYAEKYKYSWSDSSTL